MMRFERSVDVNASGERVWRVLTDLEAWPALVDTVEAVELLSPPPLAPGSRVRMKQAKLPEGVWDVTAWEPETYFELHQRSSGMTSVVGHRVEPLGECRSRLTLRFELRGLLSPVLGFLSRGMTNRQLAAEANAVKKAAENA